MQMEHIYMQDLIIFQGPSLESAPPSDIEEKLIEYNFEWL